MRPSMIVVCLLMLSPDPAVGCDNFTTEATRDLATGHRAYIEGAAGASSMMGVRMTGAGVAAVALVVVVSRAYLRESGRRRLRWDDPGVRVDAGHDREESGRHILEAAPSPGAAVPGV